MKTPAKMICSQFLVGICLFVIGCGKSDLPDVRNLVLITLDTTRADHFSCLGAEIRNTPNMDKLARRSTLFEHAVSDSNVTNPSHLTIMTGLHCLEHGLMSNAAPLPESVDTLAEAMKKRGFRTAGFLAVPHLARLDWKGFDNRTTVNRPQTAEAITTQAVEWLNRCGDMPFFIWVHYFDPHGPYKPPAAIAAYYYQGYREAGGGPRIADVAHINKRHSREAFKWLGDTRDPDYAVAMYAAEINYVDQEVGRLIGELDRLALADDTAIVLCGDHGESLGEHGIYFSHSGLWEPSVRIPLIIHLPGLPARRVKTPVTTLDIAPTMSSLFQAPVENEMSGMNLLPLMRGRQTEPRSVFIQQNAHNHAVAVRQNEWKLIWPITRDHPCVGGPPQLFNLHKDPLELHNLARREPGRVDAMRSLIDPWIERGTVEMGRSEHVTPELLEQLRALGYAGD